MSRDEFSRYHPVVNMIYFVSVISFGMFFLHPLCLGITFFSSFAYSIYLNGKKALLFNLKYMIPMLFMTALINPAFNHQGATIIRYLDNGNPVTLESITYGIAAAVMLISIIMWFSCYNKVMTSDKFIYIFGRIIPSLSLIFSMVLRFVPRFKSQIKQISYSQKCVGRDVSNGRLIERVKHGINIVSIMMTWAFENSIETADSMKARGYGLRGRTAFSIFTFNRRDKIAFIVIATLSLSVIIGAKLGSYYYRYFPSMKGIKVELVTSIAFIIYFLLCITPLVINLLEDLRWKRMQSKI